MLPEYEKLVEMAMGACTVDKWVHTDRAELQLLEPKLEQA